MRQLEMLLPNPEPNQDPWFTCESCILQELIIQMAAAIEVVAHETGDKNYELSESEFQDHPPTPGA